MKFGLGLPELSHIEALNELETFTTVDGIQGVVARVPLVDLESRDKESNYSQVNELIKTLSEDVVSRWTLRARHKNRFIPGDSKRSSSLAEIGFLEKELLLSLEWKKSSLVKNLFKKASVSSVKMPHQLLATLGCTFLSREELLNEF